MRRGRRALPHAVELSDHVGGVTAAEAGASPRRAAAPAPAGIAIPAAASAAGSPSAHTIPTARWPGASATKARRRGIDPQRVVQDHAVRPLARNTDSSRPGPSPARPSTTRSRTIATAPTPSRIVVVRTTSAPSATTSGASSSTSARRHRRSRRAPARSAPARQRDGRRHRLDASVPDSTTISTRSWSPPAARPASAAASTARPEHPRRDPLARARAAVAADAATSVDVVVVVIGDAFHARVQVAVVAECGEAAADPVGDGRDVARAGRSRRPAGRRGARSPRGPCARRRSRRTARGRSC